MTRTVYFNKNVYYYNPVLERVCKLYNLDTNKPQTMFNMIYETLSGVAMKLEKRPHDKNPTVTVEQRVPDNEVSEAKKLHRQMLAGTFLVRKAEGKDFLEVDQSDVDDIKAIAGIRYSHEPLSYAQLCDILDGKTNKYETLYFSQKKEYYEFDEEKLFENLKSTLGDNEDKTIKRAELNDVKHYIASLIRTVYALDPENSKVIHYNKKGEDFPLKDEVKEHKKEQADDTKQPKQARKTQNSKKK